MQRDSNPLEIRRRCPSTFPETRFLFIEVKRELRIRSLCWLIFHKVFFFHNLEVIPINPSSRTHPYSQCYSHFISIFDPKVRSFYSDPHHKIQTSPLLFFSTLPQSSSLAPCPSLPTFSPSPSLNSFLDPSATCLSFHHIIFLIPLFHFCQPTIFSSPLTGQRYF